MFILLLSLSPDSLLTFPSGKGGAWILDKNMRITRTLRYRGIGAILKCFSLVESAAVLPIKVQDSNKWHSIGPRGVIGSRKLVTIRCLCVAYSHQHVQCDHQILMFAARAQNDQWPHMIVAGSDYHTIDAFCAHLSPYCRCAKTFMTTFYLQSESRAESIQNDYANNGLFTFAWPLLSAIRVPQCANLDFASCQLSFIRSANDTNDSPTSAHILALHLVCDFIVIQVCRLSPCTRLSFCSMQSATDSFYR